MTEKFLEEACKYIVHTGICIISFSYSWLAVMDVIVWQFALQLPMQSVPITTDVVSSNLEQGEVYNIM